ncbi:MAG: hypothetical protein EOP04_10335 [Proteobacteria bacterium]|nr:MAG: hypothetical protein EOP04_10335 [Pseudomonadota bacterium]
MTRAKDLDSQFSFARNGYLISTDGQLVLGGTYERGERAEILEPSRRSELWCHWPELCHDLPDVLDSRVSGWMGFRSISRDHLPMCGSLPSESFFTDHYTDLWRGRREEEYPDCEYGRGQYVINGLGSKGTLFSKLTADVLGGLLLGEPLSIEWSQWLRMSPVRFWVRKHSVRPEHV